MIPPFFMWLFFLPHIIKRLNYRLKFSLDLFYLYKQTNKNPLSICWELNSVTFKSHNVLIIIIIFMIILIHDMLHSCSTISEKLHRTAFLSGIFNKSGRFFGFLCSTKYTITILFKKKILTTTYLPFSDKHIGVIYCKYLLIIIIEIHNYLNQQKKFAWMLYDKALPI